jgi:hypothetical protein
MRIAIAGDVHGHLSLLYAILGRWQRESRKPIDLILQVGDLGAFGAESTLDQATRRRAEIDPEELGFAQFESPTPPRTLLDPRPPLVFIPGNHEDFGLLARRAAAAAHGGKYPVSADRSIAALVSGRIWTFQAGEAQVRIAGISGVAGRPARPHRHPRMHLDDEEALLLGEHGADAVDIVITHERPASVKGGFRHDLGGSEALQLMLESLRPRLACFGHYDHPGEWAIGPTRVFGLASVGYKGRGTGTVNRRCILLVEWRADRVSTEWLEPPWLPGARPGDWRRWE